MFQTRIRDLNLVFSFSLTLAENVVLNLSNAFMGASFSEIDVAIYSRSP